MARPRPRPTDALVQGRRQRLGSLVSSNVLLTWAGLLPACSIPPPPHLPMASRYACLAAWPLPQATARWCLYDPVCMAPSMTDPFFLNTILQSCGVTDPHVFPCAAAARRLNKSSCEKPVAFRSFAILLRVQTHRAQFAGHVVYCCTLRPAFLPFVWCCFDVSCAQRC